MSYNADYLPSLFVIAILLTITFLVDRLYLMGRGQTKNEAKTAARAQKLETYFPLLLFVGSFLVFFLLNPHVFVDYNNYSYLADAFLHGRIYMIDFPTWLESVDFGGYTYMHFAPGSALLCIPFVALYGVNGFNCAYLAMGLGAANCSLFYLVFKRLGIGRDLRERFWCTVLAIFGTVHCFLAALGHSWFLGHVSTWFYLLLAMYCITYKGNKQGLMTFLAGFCYALAVTCRMSALLSGLFFLGYVLFYKEKKDLLRCCLTFVAGAAIPGGLYMLYNYARFGTIMDISYNLTYLKDYHRVLYDEMQLLATKKEQLAFLKSATAEVGGAQQLKFVPFNLYSIFMLPPTFSSSYPYLIASQQGQAVTILSPALLFAVRSPFRDKKKWLSITCLVTALVSMIPFLLNYGNGTAQFGMRYAMDFLPFVILMAAMGLCRKELTSWKVALILFCVLANMWGPVFWNCFY